MAEIGQAYQARELYDLFTDKSQRVIHARDKQTLEVTGIVTYAGPDIYGLPSIELSDGRGGKTFALCVFSPSSGLDAAAVGEEVRVSGVFHVVTSEFGVVLKQCRRV